MPSKLGSMTNAARKPHEQAQKLKIVQVPDSGGKIHYFAIAPVDLTPLLAYSDRLPMGGFSGLLKQVFRPQSIETHDKLVGKFHAPLVYLILNGVVRPKPPITASGAIDLGALVGQDANLFYRLASKIIGLSAGEC